MWLWVVCCAELPNLANIAIFCLLMLGGKKELVWDFWESAEWDMSGFYDDDSQPLLLWLAQIESGSDITEGNSLSKKEQTDEIEQTDENEQTEENEDDVVTSGRGGAALRSCSIRLATQLLEMRWIRFAKKRQTNCSKKVDWVSQVLADASAVSPGPGWW